MDLNLLESILYGFVSGLTDILPVSAQAHKLLLLKFFGANGEPGLMRLLNHVSILGALYYGCQPQIVKMMRAKSLSRIPKRRRKRPLDTKSLMDFSLWKTMLIPVIVAYLFYTKVSAMNNSLSLMAIFLFINGVILYVPQFLPGSNKDSRSLSRVEGLLMGLGGAASILPGVSAVGAGASIASVCGLERSYALNMTLLMNLGVCAALAVVDIFGIISGGIGSLSFGIILSYILSAATAFVGTTLGIKIMRNLAAENGYTGFTFYCWGVAIFTFILNLLA